MDLHDNNQKKWKNRTLVSSMEFAITGIITALREERNMRKHLISAAITVFAGVIFILLSIFLVMTCEIINSAIENVVDLASGYHFSILAKNAKDMAAAHRYSLRQ